ncbi:protein quaking-A isoform X4 [Phyllopteryx taeniolatus]|uniref:protein quaking-A isoform X4 n=1 Tax=Phyllopteryx taeniolatus TaxID=161469 RepID=UPI002AD38738|nr:protein quaking-A isoform X4 [Phyllopteryx taeniolatus]
MMVGEVEVKERPRPSPDYLMQLLNEKKLMTSLPNLCGIFTHLERLLDEEINRVRKQMYSDTVNGLVDRHPLELPEPMGPMVYLQEKLFVPVKEYPDYNFVGRILGPRGLTAKQLEAETGCKIMVRGKSSMRDKKKEEQNRGKPNWEHLNEDLHVLITVEDTQTRAEIKMRRAVEEVKKLLVPAAEGEDNLKKIQLMELAILNGTYRDNNIKAPAAAAAQGPRLIATPTGQVLPPQALRPQTPAGAPIMNLIRPTQMAAMLPNGTPTLVPPTPDAGLIYTTPYDYPYALAPTSLLEYPIEHSGVLGAMATKVRRHDTRVHPYQRIVTADRGQFSLLATLCYQLMHFIDDDALVGNLYCIVCIIVYVFFSLPPPLRTHICPHTSYMVRCGVHVLFTFST